jgi:VanZ family protein
VNHFRAFCKHWLPVIVWMTIIFSASGDSHSYHRSYSIIEPILKWLFPHISPRSIDIIHHIGRKTCHLAEYAILALLLWRAFRLSTGNRFSRWYWPEAGLALAGVFLYAASDEFHQSFIPGRTPLVSDVFIDTTGGAIGLFLLWLIRFRLLPRAPSRL